MPIHRISAIQPGSSQLKVKEPGSQSPQTQTSEPQNLKNPKSPSILTARRSGQEERPVIESIARFRAGLLPSVAFPPSVQNAIDPEKRRRSQDAAFEIAAPHSGSNQRGYDRQSVQRNG